MIYLLPQAVDEVAVRDPGRLAMRFLDQTLTYEALAERSNHLAAVLREHGVRRLDRVGIYLDKCLDIPVALHGIMKAGAAYVPLDPAAPPERLAGIVEDCAIRHVVSSDAKRSGLARILERTPLQCVVGASPGQVPGAGTCLPWSEVENADAGAPGPKILEDDLAYVIYTSGSTGRPKGIMHTHRSSLSFSRWAAEEYCLREEDLLSNHAPLHFDLSILDFFAGAVAGCATSIIPEEHTKFPASYCALIADHGITVLYTVPFALVQLLLRGALERHDLSRLRLAIFGGEPFPIKHLRELMRRLPHVQFDNIYGPAEVNGVTHYPVEAIAEGADSIPIGPLATQADGLVVDDGDNVVETGQVGELLVRTPTMMRGYWGRPELSERAFHRRTPVPGFEEVFYRTGDLVREDERGMLWFLGRKDRQVKVRGYRVELDEVEAALVSSEDVEEAAAIALPAVDGSQEIMGIVRLKGGVAPDAADSVLAGVTRVLPPYAVPSAIEVTDAFPRTTTGKIDRLSLRNERLVEDLERSGPR